MAYALAAARQPCSQPFLGKILKDEETVESYKIEESGFVVCMVNKVRYPIAATAQSPPIIC